MLLALAMLLMLPALLCLAKYHGPRRGVYDADVVNKKAIQQELLPGDMDESKDDLLPGIGGNADISDNAEPIMQNPIMQNPIMQNPIMQNPIMQKPIIQKPIMQKPIIGKI